MSLIVVKFCCAEVAKTHTDEFSFVNSYIECLENYSKTDYAMCIPIRFIVAEKNINYSAEEVINSDSMKQLKKEQEFISRMVREMEKYSNSPIEGIKKVANRILERYRKKQALNVKAQDTYFYTKTGKFKAGIATSDELFKEEESIDDMSASLEEVRLFWEILVPPRNSSMRITCKEKDLLLGKVRELKQRPFENQHLGHWPVKFFVRDMEQFLMINSPCLKEAL
jgi:hypothetical protein